MISLPVPDCRVVSVSSVKLGQDGKKIQECTSYGKWAPIGDGACAQAILSCMRLSISIEIVIQSTGQEGKPRNDGTGD